MLKKCPICFSEMHRTQRESKVRYRCRPCAVAYSKKYREQNPEKILEYRKKYQTEIRPTYSAEWKRNNPERYRAYCRRQRLNKPRKTPKYIPEKDGEYQRQRRQKIKRASLWGKDKVKQIIKERPEGMFVDHIIPIFNENVCGLHVPENLQYLTPRQSGIKGKSFDFTLDNNSWRKFDF